MLVLGGGGCVVGRLAAVGVRRRRSDSWWCVAEMEGREKSELATTYHTIHTGRRQECVASVA